MYDAGPHTDHPALVLLHGWTATAAVNWGGVQPLLARDHRTVALDHRGHGRGIRPNPWRGFRLADCADDAVALADVLGLERFIPVGYSMGGPVAQLVWRRHPERVAGLVLCATGRNFRGGTPPPVLRELALAGGVAGVAAALRVLPAAARRRISAAGTSWRRRVLPAWAFEEVARNDPASLVEAYRELQTFNSADWIGEIDVPTAVVVTTRDRVVPAARQRKLAAAIPHATVWPFPGDHDACVVRARAFAAVLNDACRAVAEESVLVQRRR